MEWKLTRVTTQVNLVNRQLEARFGKVTYCGAHLQKSRIGKCAKKTDEWVLVAGWMGAREEELLPMCLFLRGDEYIMKFIPGMLHDLGDSQNY